MSKRINVFSQTKKSDYFNTDYLRANLKQQSVRGGLVTIAAQASKFTLKFGSTIVLARMLSPDDYGLIGMATVVIGFAEYFKDLGLSSATIQRREINHQQISTLFWINLGIGCLMAGIIALAAPEIAAFYDEPLLKGITLSLAFNFILGGLTVQHQALLRRQMEFTSLARVEIISMIVGVVVAITTAYLGLGYWALILMLTATAFTNLVGVWLACSWRPGLPRRHCGVRSMLAYGGNLTGFSAVNYFSRNLDNILIGRRWGSAQLGLYAQAYRLLLLPIQQINNPINSVALPTLSSLQTEPEKYSRYYYKAILLITTLGMPIVAFMFAAADNLILLMLGEQWLGTVPLFKFLIPAAFVGTFNVATGWVYQSLGRTDRQFRIGIFMATINTIIFAVSVNWGTIGVARAYGCTQPILIILALNYCFWQTHLRVRDFAKAIFRPAFASITAALILMVINHFLLLFDNNLVLSLLVDCVLYSLLYLILWLVLPGGKKTLVEIAGILRLGKRKSSVK